MVSSKYRQYYESALVRNPNYYRDANKKSREKKKESEKLAPQNCEKPTKARKLKTKLHPEFIVLKGIEIF